MEYAIRRSIAALTLTMMAGCASNQGPSASDAVADFIAVSELQEMDKVRTRDQYHFSTLTERHVILKTREDRYLVEFRRRCRELDRIDITPDLRYDRNVLRPGIDTIRGCRINRMFAIDEVQTQELEHLGKAPGN